MSRLAIPANVEAAPAASKPPLAQVQAKLGVVPNLFRLIGSSTALLEGFLSLNAAAGKTLDVKTRERIAIAVAGVNGCDYCMSAHFSLGEHLAKLDAAELAANRAGRSNDPKASAVVTFAHKLAETRGKVSEADPAAVKAAGYSDAQIVDILLVIAENYLTNLVNNVAATDIDFPFVSAGAA
jgi:uncharacterized peroxidase-related enzyme